MELTARGKTVKGSWAVGNRRGGIERRDRAFLLRQQNDRGIIASGHFTSQVYQDLHWDGSGRGANYAHLRCDTVVDTADRLPVEQGASGPFRMGPHPGERGSIAFHHCGGS